MHHNFYHAQPYKICDRGEKITVRDREDKNTSAPFLACFLNAAYRMGI
jgi:hypothetical protein